MITLYGFDTVNTLKVLILLEEIGAAYKLEPINIRTGEQHSAAFRAINPNGKVPVIVDHAGFQLTESGAILIHLADRFDCGLASKGTARDRALEWLTYQLSTQGPMFGQIEYWAHLAEPKQPGILAHFQKIGQKVFGQMDTRLSQTRYFAGEDFTIADIAHYAWMTRLGVLGLSLNDAPHITRWMDDLSQRPAIQRAVAFEKAIQG